MATRFMRVDLSEDARDYRPVAIEPGVPLLDRANANAKILFRWLGGLAAEPMWEGESVSFFVRDDHGGRLEECVCQPATADDIKRTLQGDVNTLRDRIEKAKPETPTERALKKTLRQQFQELADNPNRTDLDSFFFRYRDANGNWRLVWCWGYQRVDQEPAPAVVCGDEECGLLFVRRPGQSPKCPACEAALALRPTKRHRLRRKRVLVPLLLLLLLALLAAWYFYPTRLVATPGEFAGPPGSRVEFTLRKSKLFWKKDVTNRAVGVVLDPAVARLDPMGTAVTLTGLGKTLVRFHLGNLATDATLISGETKLPASIAIVPKNAELAVGTTAHLKLIGKYEDGSEVDLTDAAVWTPQNDGIVFAYNGLLEGLAEGNSTVTARYRPTPERDFLDATANVSVAEVELKSLELGVEPTPVGVARASELRIDAVAADGSKYSVLDSSLLDTQVTPPYMAAVEGRRLTGRHAGAARLTATFKEKLTAGTQFDVEFVPGLDKLAVYPEKLEMVVGQIADLNIVSPSQAPIYVRSANADLVRVTENNRLVARAEGGTQVEVIQGNQKRSVDVAIGRVSFDKLIIDPASVAVLVDHTAHPRVLARVNAAPMAPVAPPEPAEPLKEGRQPGEGEEAAAKAPESPPPVTVAGRYVEIAPGLLTIQRQPSPRYADLDPKTLGLHGISPTDPSIPQSLGVYFDTYEASAPVEVIVAPLRLALKPAGPVDLPLGQQRRLSGWATYSGGHRVQIVPGRMDFQSESPSDAVPGLELRGDRVAALKPNAGPLNVLGTYFGSKSKPVVFNSVEAGPVTLKLDVDRTIRLAGETGLVTMSGTDPKGDVDLVPELAKYESSDPEILKIDEKTGAFAANAEGEVTITGTHPAAKEPATLKLEVFDPAKARLVFDPDSLKLAVDEVADLPLYLEVDDEGEIKRALLSGPGIGYAMTRPDAVRWSPPRIQGLSPAAPFELSASLYPILSVPATAQIEVTPSVSPEMIRVVPSSAQLASGQTIALKVEQQLPGTPDVWREVNPGAVTWTVPPRLIWTEATQQLRPTATVPEDAPREFELLAGYGGKEAMAVIKVKPKGLDPNDPAARVYVAREPQGEYVPVGGRQRIAIMVEKDGVAEPAAKVTWPEDFENDYVRWQAPVLTVKKPGFQQWFRAQAGERNVLWHTTTYAPGQFDVAPPREDQPVAVLILSDQGPKVRFPVGAVFAPDKSDFRVEARYADGFTRVVTKKATFRMTPPGAASSVAPVDGQLRGVRPGVTKVRAEFDGVRSKQPLECEVTAEVDIDQLRISPAPVTILPGETFGLGATGYKQGKSVGDLSGLGGMIWQSTSPEIASLNGPMITGMNVGQTTATAQLGTVLSQQTQVNVVASIADALVLTPDFLQIRAGQSAHVGTDISVYRAEMNVSNMCTVTPAVSGVVRFVPETRSLVGVAPGASAVAFTLGDKLTNAMIEVVPGGPIDGEIVLEPASGTLAPGQALPLRVLVITPQGDRIDRTDSAILTSSDPSTVMIHGNRACAVKGPGTAQITARLSGTEQLGKGRVAVNSLEITDLVVEPAQLAMSTGDVRALRILGRADSGTYELFPQQGLSVTPGGANPDAIQIDRTNAVRAVRPGQADVAVNWRDRLSRQVPVSVQNNPWTDLRIEPSRATIVPGQPLVYQVTAMRGGERRALTAADGVRLGVSQPSVAQLARDDLAVRGANPGHTAVVAQLSGLTAEAGLDVVPAGTGSTAVVGGPGTVGVYGPGTAVYDGVDYIDRYGYGGYRGTYVDDDYWVGTGPGGVVVDHGYGSVITAPRAGQAGLRFAPDVLNLPTNSPGAAVQVFEILLDGTLGRDVTSDPALEISRPQQIARLEGNVFRPLQPGQERIGARLGNLTAEPLLLSVGQGMAGMARLIVSPDPLNIWSGELGTFGSVTLDPGGGQLPFEIGYTVTPAAGQGIVEKAGGQMLRGVANGTAPVVVTAVDPGGAYDGLSATAMVEVTSAAPIWIEPGEINLRVGQASPRISVMTRGADGLPLPVAGTLESMDGNVTTPEEPFMGRFVAKGLGQTKLRAEYHGKEAFANVTVTGDRFVQVVDTFNGGEQDFDITLEVLAAASEGPLQYRVYESGQAAAETWVPAQTEGEFQRVTLRSPRLPYRQRGALYNLIIEARDAAGATQHYPITFRLTADIERADQPESLPQPQPPADFDKPF